jgi:hypothetical protein
MNRKRRIILWVVIAGLCLAVAFFIFAGVYALLKINALRRQPAYATPEEGLRQLIPHWHPGVKKFEIEGKGEEFSPDLIYIASRIWIGGNASHQSAGSFFLRTKRGWVFIPEDDFPWLIVLGKRVFALSDE